MKGEAGILLPGRIPGKEEVRSQIAEVRSGGYFFDFTSGF
jgi:hypothetical protein